MHHHNWYYGQAQILAKYCDIKTALFPPRIRGYLQHGWNVGCGWNPIHEFFDGAWRWVWSDAPMKRGYALGRRNHHIIGAPWLYLLETHPKLGLVAEDEREGTLWFVFHGWEGGKIHGDHARLIDQIREVEDGPVTVSLYYTEYERPEIRHAYMNSGFEVVSFGKRGWNYEGANVRFLHEQLRAMRKVKKVASNRLASAIFYGASVGCEIAVYGDPMSMDGDDPLFGGLARIERLWPELLGNEIDLQSVLPVVEYELGVPWIVPPEELRALMFDGDKA